MIRNRPMFRPPAEADSLILQVDEGCPHNGCAFCGMYKGVGYRRRSLAEVARLIEKEGRGAREARRVFLADGDVMSRPFEELESVLKLLGASLPKLARVNVYANGSSIASKTADELVRLRELKLQTLYMGLESGDEALLAECRKGETAEGMIAAGVLAQSCGLRMSVMVLPGLGGVAGSERHIAGTAAAVNRMNPRLLSALRYVPVPGTELWRESELGRFEQLSEFGAVAELRALVARLELEGTVFRANHVSNVVPIEGRFPRDKVRILRELDELLEGGGLDRHTPGRLPMWL